MAVQSGRSRKLRCSWGRIGRRLKSSEATRAKGLSEAEAPEQLGPYRLKALVQRSCEGRGAIEAEGCDAARLFRPRVNK